MLRSIAMFAFVGIPCASGNWAAHYELGTPVQDVQPAPTPDDYRRSVSELNVDSLFHDIKRVMKHRNHPEFPPDFVDANGEGGHYGGLFVRLAWHCSGTYRKSDGKGGCAGGGQRFEPLRSWDDNVNLDKARAILSPVKAKYGDSLSWGDLIIAAGTTALRDMGAPIEQVCFGRQDDPDGNRQRELDPREGGPPCNPFVGKCESPLGATTPGLIYVNPEGPVVEEGGDPVPDPVLSAADIRDAFGRMGDDDRATVALIGGGHAIGKCHGACNKTNAQGKNPFEAFSAGEAMAWQGTCGEGVLQGKGPNTFSSGFEGPWSPTPKVWSNGFFKGLLNFDWEKHIGPGGHYQWRIAGATGELAGLMRLTTDIALLNDDSYLALTKEFAADENALIQAFSDAWFKLTHRGGMWAGSGFCDVGTIPQWVLEQNLNKMLDSDAVVV